MPDEMVMEPPKAALSSPPLIVTVPPLVLPSYKARVKLPLMLVDDNPEMIDPSPPAAPDKLQAVTLNAPPMLVPEPTEIAMLPPKLDADKPFPISKAPLLPTLAVPVLNDRSPNTTAVPALHVNMATLPELVAVPTPNEMVMESPKTVLQSKRLVASSNESDVNAVLIFVRCAIWFCNDFHSSLYLTSASEVCMWPLAGSTNMHENNGSVSQYFLSGAAISTGCCYLVQSWFTCCC